MTLSPIASAARRHPQLTGRLNRRLRGTRLRSGRNPVRRYGASPRRCG